MAARLGRDVRSMLLLVGYSRRVFILHTNDRFGGCFQPSRQAILRLPS